MEIHGFHWTTLKIYYCFIVLVHGQSGPGRADCSRCMYCWVEISDYRCSIKKQSERRSQTRRATCRTDNSIKQHFYLRNDLHQTLSSKRHRADVNTLTTQVFAICLIKNQSALWMEQSEQCWIHRLKALSRPRKGMLNVLHHKNVRWVT